MRKVLYIIMGFLVLSSCSKDVDERVVADFEPVSLDSTGGTWKTIHLASSADVSIPVPEAVNSTAYKAEIDQIVSMQQTMSAEDNRIVSRWKNSGVIRWNEVARELVAVYNIPPEANADGTYPAPSAANPGAYPKFPFANPPYASRAYAYLHTAMYDALVTVWKYKFQHKRMSPAVNDSRVKALETLQDGLPSYPSEDAAVAQVAYRMLRVLFPNDTLMLQQMAAEQKKAKMLSGAASATDIAAGEQIANAVAEKALARLRTDGMGAAGGNPTVWAQIEQDAVARGNKTPWKSMETPARPMMLPVFGNVKLWQISPSQRDSLRPEAPPAVGSEKFNQELAEVKSINRAQNSKEWQIALYWADGVGTYTPPGHWNEITSYKVADEKLNELRTARVFSLLNMAMADAAICCWDTKSYYFTARPTQVDPSIKTIGLPNFPSYTSGHSTFSGAAATVLGFLFPADKPKFTSMAQEASVSRIYGGIHYRSDCEVGLKCGNAIGSFSVKFGERDGAK
ncbi:MAG TPA: vanadium-dependent haloperoxidase [Chitinophagaceae bacterium]|nr:vanadium-dependent haloperoxidase [Chitinophagaceae bacterium]